MPGYLIYCRKSSEAEDRQVLSIESQISALKELAAKLGLPVTEVLTESKSAKEPGRPVFNQLVQRIYRGEAAGILCWKLDRLARNPVDGGSVIWAIKQHGIRVVTPAQNFARDDDNIILMYIEFGMAQKYVDDLSKNVKRGLKTKIEKGWYPGVAPAGYLNHTDKLTGENRLVKDPERFPLIRRMWDLMLTGQHTPPRIRELANDQWGYRTRPTRKMGGKAMVASAIYQIFTKPFYYGWFEYPKGSGLWYQGRHEPMVTRAEYDRVQTLLGRTGIPRPSVHLDFAFTGLIRCGECGGSITAEVKHQVICGDCRSKFAHRQRESCPRCEVPIARMNNPKFLCYTYYHCTKRKYPGCSQKSVAAEALEHQIDDFLSRIQISKRFQDWALKYLQELHAQEIKSRDTDLESQRKAYDACLRQLDNLVKLKTSPQNTDGSLLSDAEYGRQRVELLREKARVEELLQDAGHGAQKWLESAEAVFRFSCLARERFAQGDSQTKKQILATVGSNLILKDKKLLFEALKPFSVIEMSMCPSTGHKELIEPKKEGLPQGRNGQTDPELPSVLGRLHDVRTLYHKSEYVVKAVYRYFRSVDAGLLEQMWDKLFSGHDPSLN